MLDPEIEKKYRSQVRKSHPRSGATWQRLSETDGKPCNEASPYWEHVHNSYKKQRQWNDHDGGVFNEVDAASADGRAYNEKGDLQSLIRNEDCQKEVVARVRKLVELSKQILTEQQYHVFILMAVKDPHLTVRETAKVLSISSSRVGQLWTAARKKLEKAYEQRTA